MTRQPLISVIVPAFNAEKYVQDCMDSILKQTYECFEVIVVDDGSQDKTAIILKNIAANDSRVKIITQSNQGSSAARNEALRHCKGEYITMIDADDLVSQDYLEVLLALALETNADITLSAHTRNPKLLGLSNESYTTLDAQVFISKILYKRLSNNVVGGALFRRSVWEGVSFYPHYYEDLEVFPRLTDKAETVTITSARLYYYRPVDTGNTGHVSEKRLDVLHATDSILDYLHSKNKESLLPAARCRKLSASFNVHVITAKHPEYSTAHAQAWKNIVDLRKECLLNPNVILKIKLGILLSYMGSGAICACNRLFRISS